MKKPTKGQVIRAIVTLPLVAAFIWYMSTHVFIYPKIELWRNGSRTNTTLIEIKQGYKFADESYTIEDTANGYNVIIHLEEK